MPKVHIFESTAEAYDASQTSDVIKDGDILSVPSEGVFGFLLEAWPLAVTIEAGEFHVAMAPLAPSQLKKYADAITMCQNGARMMGFAIDPVAFIDTTLT